eukprot:6214770-Pleurochrysis_carterae.AAC.7
MHSCFSEIGAALQEQHFQVTLQLLLRVRVSSIRNARGVMLRGRTPSDDDLLHDGLELTQHVLAFHGQDVCRATEVCVDSVVARVHGQQHGAGAFVAGDDGCFRVGV